MKRLEIFPDEKALRDEKLSQNIADVLGVGAVLRVWQWSIASSASNGTLDWKIVKDLVEKKKKTQKSFPWMFESSANVHSLNGIIS